MRQSCLYLSINVFRFWTFWTEVLTFCTFKMQNGTEIPRSLHWPTSGDHIMKKQLISTYFKTIFTLRNKMNPPCLHRPHGPLGPSVWWRQQPVPSLFWDWSTLDPETGLSDSCVLHWRVLSPNIHAAAISNKLNKVLMKNANESVVY